MSHKRIGEILIEEGFLKPGDLKKGLEIQEKEGGLLGEILVRKGWLKEEDLMIGLSRQLSLPFIHLAQYQVNPKAPKLIPKEVAERYLLFPFEEEGGSVSLAMADPCNAEALKEAEKHVSGTLHIFLVSSSEIRQAVKRFYAASVAVG